MLWFFKSFFPVVWITFLLHWRIKAIGTKTNQRIESTVSGVLRTVIFVIVVVLLLSTSRIPLPWLFRVFASKPFASKGGIALMSKEQTRIARSNAIEIIRADYDRIARDYAAHFERELYSKPVDQTLLSQFAHSVRGRGNVCDMGCGSGQVTRWLHELAVPIFGLDLSPKMIQEARSRSPEMSFQVGNMLELQLANETLAGIVAFYAIVNLPKDSVAQAFREMARVLKSGGLLLLAFHIGNEVISPGQWQKNAISMKFFLFQPIEIQGLLSEAGFSIEDTIERDPYPNVEYQSRRAYILARK